MHVRKLDYSRVLRDMAEEAFLDEHLPEIWHHENPKTYAKKLRRAKKVPRVDITDMAAEGVLWHFKFVVSPILHSEPWQAEHFLPYLDRAKYWLENGLVLCGRRRDADAVTPIIEAFAEAGY